MKAPRPVGVLRLLAPLLGRARRRRGGPLVPMIWRRRVQARPGTRGRAARPVIVAPAHHWSLNLILVWPARTAARTAPMRTIETRMQEIFRAGREAGAGEARRLACLVERLWLHSGKPGTPAPAISSAATVAEPASSLPALSVGHDTQSAPPRRAGQPVPVAAQAGGVSRLWPRARMIAARATLSAPAPGASAPPAREAAAGPASVGAAGPDGRSSRLAGQERALRPPRAGPVRAWHEFPAPRPPAGRDAAASFPLRTPTGPLRRGAEAPSGRPRAERSRSSPPRTTFVWRKGETGGESVATAPVHSTAYRTSRTELVWRRPPADPARGETGAAEGGSTSVAAPNPVFVRADRPAMSTASAPTAPSPAPAALQPAEMSRLVDEVVRRLDRIGRDERLRRGI